MAGFVFKFSSLQIKVIAITRNYINFLLLIMLEY